MCIFCDNLQDIHLYFNYEDFDSLEPNVPNDYTEIQNEKVKELLKKWFLGFIDDAKCPLVFGSLTNWKIQEMIPT